MAQQTFGLDEQPGAAVDRGQTAQGPDVTGVRLEDFPEQPFRRHRLASAECGISRGQAVSRGVACVGPAECLAGLRMTADIDQEVAEREPG